MSFLSALKGSFALTDKSPDVRLTSAPPPPPTSRVTMADVTAPPPPPEAKLATAPEDPFDNPENPLGDESEAIESTSKQPEPREIDDFAGDKGMETIRGESIKALKSEEKVVIERIDDQAAPVMQNPESSQEERERLAQAGQESKDKIADAANQAENKITSKPTGGDPITEMELEARSSDKGRDVMEPGPSSEERRAELESVLGNTPGTNPLSEAGAREELEKMASEGERTKKREDVQAGLTERAHLQRERAKYQKELREANNRPMATALAEQELARVERELKDLGTPEKAFADRVQPKGDEALPVIEGEASEKPEAPLPPAVEGEPEKDSNEEQLPVIDGESAKPGIPFPERPTMWERLSDRGRSVYETAMRHAERSILGRVMAFYHDNTRSEYEEKTQKAIEILEKRQKRLAKLEGQVEKYSRGPAKFFYDGILQRAQAAVRVAERKIRRTSSLMEYHSERQNKYLRTIEDRYVEKLRPFEELADRERERYAEAAETNKVRREVRDVLAKQLASIEADAKQEKGFFMSSEMRQKVNDVREKLRGIDNQIRQSERDVAQSNARLLSAEKKADTWRDKIDELRAASSIELPTIDTTTHAPERVPGPRLSGETEAETSPTSSVETIAAASVSAFIEDWNRSKRAEDPTLDAARFAEVLKELKKTSDVPSEASLKDLGAVADRLMSESSKTYADMSPRRRNKELRERLVTVETLLSNRT